LLHFSLKERSFLSGIRVGWGVSAG
jgi:hypothetical protein